MARQRVNLENCTWDFDDTKVLGSPGGFGTVFEGQGPNGAVAIKRLNLTAGAAAHRELKIGGVLALRTLTNVVPVLDSGQDAQSDRYYLVMPICERSLQDHLSTRPLGVDGARAVAIDVLMGLKEVGDIVHRDLKPGNVLFLNGRWCLADFGIAKFVEDSTSLQTLRGSLTPSYGAPEQWRGEAPTHATDVYAMGCIMHAMLTGHPPFHGSSEAIREAHLHNPAPALTAAGPRLAGLVSQMLRKSPEARPTIDRCIEVFQASSTDAAKPVHAALLAASGVVATKAAEADAAARALESRKREREALTDEGLAELQQIRQRLFAEVLAISDDAKASQETLQLGQGTLKMTGGKAVGATSSGKPNLDHCGWDVCAEARISVTRGERPQDNIRSGGGFRFIVYDGDYVWSASLVFAKTPQDGSYRWREVSFWRISRLGDNDEPMAISAQELEFDIALSNVMGVVRIATGPSTIDGEDEDEFRSRWLTLLGRAATGALERPNQMPVPASFFR